MSVTPLPERIGEIEHAAKLLGDADAVVVAASNGFDIADGYNQFACDAAFLDAFDDFRTRYGISCILHGLGAAWPAPEARWAFLARLIDYGFTSYSPSPVMQALDEATAGKPRFVVTCNCNGRFERADFDTDALFETEGSFARARCAARCADEDFDAAKIARSILSACRESGNPRPTEIPTELVPRCPRCGAALDVAADDGGGLASSARFQGQKGRFQAFLDVHARKRITVLELGLGQANRAIKAPLARFAESAPDARYLIFNRDAARAPRIAPERTAFVQGDLGETLPALASAVAAGGAR